MGIDDPIVSVPDAGQWARHITESFALEVLPVDLQDDAPSVWPGR
ncbi:hypothetical protein AB0M48_01790 [Lentzea sp. NPDC051208]